MPANAMRRGSRAGTLVACILLAGCTDLTLQDALPYDYTTQPIAILNTDWGVLPLPNDFLNPVRQAQVVAIPGIPLPSQPPTTMALPIVDAAAATLAQGLGYPVTEDPPLSKALLGGMNRLDGFVTSFAPSIPFNRPVAMDSVVPYDGMNAPVANLYFLDITDPEAPVVFQPEEYLRVFNWEMRDEMPFKLSMRFPSPGILQPPADFLPGHTYAVVVTGWSEAGVKDDQGNPFKSDGSFLVFAQNDLFSESGTAYIGPDGGSRNSVLPDLASAQSAEGARQLTNHVLRIWESLDGVAGSWTRSQVVAAFAFTTATNPMPDYFDPVMAFLGMPAVVPQPADAVDGQGRLVKADAPCNGTLTFTLDKPIDLATATPATVRLFRVDGASYTEVPLDVAATNGAKATVTATPKVALAGSALHLVAVTNGIRSLDGSRGATDQTYFGLTRAALKTENAAGAWSFLDTPLVAAGPGGKPIWQSAYLDSRLDTLILNGAQDEIDEAALEAAGATVIGILSYLEAMRGIYKPHMDWLVLGDDGKPGVPGAEGTDNVVAEREDLVLVWTFTTAACGQ